MKMKIAIGSKTIEIVQDYNGFGLHIWPSAQMLAEFVVSHANIFKDKTVLELGAGVALPGLVAAACGARDVILTDKYPHVLKNCQDEIQRNGLQNCARTTQLSWGDVESAICTGIDVVLGSDCLYNSEDFEPVLATIHYIFQLNPNRCSAFYTTYHVRSVTRSIAHLLEYWELNTNVMDCQEETIYLLKITPKYN